MNWDEIIGETISLAMKIINDDGIPVWFEISGAITLELSV